MSIRVIFQSRIFYQSTLPLFENRVAPKHREKICAAKNLYTSGDINEAVASGTRPRVK